MSNYLSDKLTLGILLKNNKPVNHRSLTKVLLNPILRSVGFCLGTVFTNENHIKKIIIFKCDKTKLKYDFNSFNEYDKIIKNRIYF